MNNHFHRHITLIKLSVLTQCWIIADIVAYGFLDRVLFLHDSCDYHWKFYGRSFYFELRVKAFCNKAVIVLQVRTSLDVSTPGHSLWILDWTCYFGLLYTMFRLSTGIFYGEFPGFATACDCGVRWRGLTTCLLYVGRFFWKSSL